MFGSTVKQYSDEQIVPRTTLDRRYKMDCGVFEF